MVRDGDIRMTVDIPVELHRRVKIRAAIDATEIRALVIDGLERILKDRPGFKQISPAKAARLQAIKPKKGEKP